MKKILCVFLALLTVTLTGCGDEKEVYSGEGYEFSYDPDKWELAFDDNDWISFDRKDFYDENFGVHRYIPEEHLSLNELLENLEKISETLGQIWDGGEIVEKDGVEWGKEEYRQEIKGDMFKCVIYFTDIGTYIYSVTYFVAEDAYEAGLPDFEEVFDSFKFTE